MIPCFNEAGNIAAVVRGVRAHLPRVLVVDDGSTDATAAFAAAAGAEVLRHDSNRGKGAALRTGFARALALGASWILTLDGDGQHAPEDIPQFLNLAAQTPAALIIGNRFVRSDQIPFLRRQVNRWMTRRLCQMSGCSVPDSQCGFRLIRSSALAQIHLRTDHFETESELLVAVAHAGLEIATVPVAVIYGSGQSKIRPLRDAWRWWRWRRGILDGTSTPAAGGATATE